VSNDSRTPDRERAPGLPAFAERGTPRMGVHAEISPAGWTDVLLRVLGWAGIVLLYVAACAWGVLEVHYSNDTWIGLAAGRQIMTEPSFPKTDTFSYPFYGQIWFNQNWLSHVFFWLLYDKLGPTALVIGTWAVSFGTFAFVLGATWFRSRSSVAAFFAATAVAVSSRDWLSIRPATIQFFLLAATWFSLSALLGQGERRRWWPIALLLLILGAWPHAHGSFLFGFGLLGLFLGCAALAGLLSKKFSVRSAISLRQGIALAAVGVVAVGLSVVLSPYGIENLTHPFKIVESEVFRRVGEWFPPYRLGQFPAVTRFWIFFAMAVASPLVMLALRLLTAPVSAHHGFPINSTSVRAQRQASMRSKGPAGRPQMAATSGEKPPCLDVILFDIASVGIGLYMAMFARRFAPVFYILATPVIVSWIMQLARPLPARARHVGWWGAVCGCWIGAVVSIGVTAHFAYKELVTDLGPSVGYDLLDRVTCTYRTPSLSLEFLLRNDLKPNVMTEWKVAGSVMFFVPGARVFIDGRAQQVYTEDHFLAYSGLMSVPPAKAAAASDLLDHFKTDVVLLPKWDAARPLITALERQPQWQMVLNEPQSILWVRQGSPVLDELIRRQQAGTLWWPEQPAQQQQDDRAATGAR